VVFREDLMSRMLRNLVSVKDGTKGDEMKRFVSPAVVHSQQRRRTDYAGFAFGFKTSLFKRSWTRSTSHRYPSMFVQPSGSGTMLSGSTPCRQQ
jgi:hypothetical protein